VAAALFLACGMVAQYRAQRAAAAVSAPRGAGGGPVELLTFEMLHDPHCKADKHCHSACRMVCDEVNSGQGAREHAATLISFGCCLSAPVITKQAGSPVQLAPSPLQLLSVRQPAKEQMLFEVNAKGHIRFDRPADTRKDSVAVHVLRDRHSLAADLRDLEREQAALKKRVSKLRIQDVLPFRVAAGQSLVRRGSKHPGKLYPEGPGSTDPYYDEEDKLPDTWEEPECDLPAILKGKVKCTIGNKRKITGTDPNGVDRQAAGQVERPCVRGRGLSRGGLELAGVRQVPRLPAGCGSRDRSCPEHELPHHFHRTCAQVQRSVHALLPLGKRVMHAHCSQSCLPCIQNG
jgi:hypothetical protein